MKHFWCWSSSSSVAPKNIFVQESDQSSIIISLLECALCNNRFSSLDLLTQFIILSSIIWCRSHGFSHSRRDVGDRNESIQHTKSTTGNETGYCPLPLCLPPNYQHHCHPLTLDWLLFHTLPALVPLEDNLENRQILLLSRQINGRIYSHLIYCKLHERLVSPTFVCRTRPRASYWNSVDRTGYNYTCRGINQHLRKWLTMSLLLFAFPAHAHF